MVAYKCQVINRNLLAVKADLEARARRPDIATTFDIPAEDIHMIDTHEIVAVTFAVAAKANTPIWLRVPARYGHPIDVRMAVNKHM